MILGTAAVENPALVVEACRRFNDSIIVGIDAREGYVATRGWVKNTEQTAVGLAKAMAQVGVKRFVYTDITRDGTLTEPNIPGDFRDDRERQGCRLSRPGAFALWYT